MGKCVTDSIYCLLLICAYTPAFKHPGAMIFKSLKNMYFIKSSIYFCQYFYADTSIGREGSDDIPQTYIAVLHHLIYIIMILIIQSMIVFKIILCHL